MKSFWSVSKLWTESVGSRRELCSHRRRDETNRRDETRQFRLVGVGGMCIGLYMLQLQQLRHLARISWRARADTRGTGINL